MRRTSSTFLSQLKIEWGGLWSKSNSSYYYLRFTLQALSRDDCSYTLVLTLCNSNSFHQQEIVPSTLSKTLNECERGWGKKLPGGSLFQTSPLDAVHSIIKTSFYIFPVIVCIQNAMRYWHDHDSLTADHKRQLIALLQGAGERREINGRSGSKFERDLESAGRSRYNSTAKRLAK